MRSIQQPKLAPAKFFANSSKLSAMPAPPLWPLQNQPLVLSHKFNHNFNLNQRQ
jgi:hypothetical protein